MVARHMVLAGHCGGAMWLAYISFAEAGEALFPTEGSV